MAQLRVALLACLALAACATGPDPEREVLDRAWGGIVREADAVPLGEGRVRVTVASPFVANLDAMEYAALARAAGAARQAGAPRFAIVHLDYEAGGPLRGLLAPGVDLPGPDWVGTFEDLQAARAWQDITGAVDGRYGLRTITMIVRLLDEGEAPGRPAFATGETLDAMLAERIARRGIAPRRRLALPFGL